MSADKMTSVGPVATEPAEAISRWVSPGVPMLIFELDTPEPDVGTAQRYDVRLVGSVRGRRAGSETPQEVSAVLLLRAPSPSRLLSCVRAITRGAGLPADSLLPAPGEDPERTRLERKLTDRECQVLRLLADGGSTREIAGHMCYSERTVKNIVRSLLDKLNCRTRAQAVALAARQGAV